MIGMAVDAKLQVLHEKLMAALTALLYVANIRELGTAPRLSRGDETSTAAKPATPEGAAGSMAGPGIDSSQNSDCAGDAEEELDDADVAGGHHEEEKEEDDVELDPS